MLKKLFFTLMIVACGSSQLSAQTDSTDLDLFTNDAVLVTALDTMLYGDGSFDQLVLDFTVSDTVSFGKVHVELTRTGTDELIFRKVYTLSDLTTESLISSWDVTLPFGNLPNDSGYKVAIIIEAYDGSLGTTITKTFLP